MPLGAMSVEELRLPAPRLALAPILRFQRCHDPAQVAPAILEVARDMVALAQMLAEPRVMHTTRAVARLDATSLVLAEGPTFTGRCFATHLGGAREVVAWVATIGAALDERVLGMLGKNDLLQALFLESAGWLAIEDALRSFRASVTARVRPEHLRPSARLGPGYLDWPLAEQPALFSLFAGAPLPVMLNDSCVMMPKQSLSGLFGLVPRS